MHETGSARESVLRLLEEEGGASEDAVRRVAERTGAPEAEIWGAGSFYGLLKDPRPRHRVCDGLSCQIAGGDKLARNLEGAGREVERVGCLGQCLFERRLLIGIISEYRYPLEEIGLASDFDTLMIGFRMIFIGECDIIEKDLVLDFRSKQGHTHLDTGCKVMPYTHLIVYTPLGPEI